ncbi:hypothetical protein [Streptomyces sp. NBC_01294]|uniref:hypothetical protein n=1 Tax=Streptomyces sp. NBC_01294 TaxID=2903815 RepID=UPI002DDC8126|nr:hypothetical protein [Streptomyces sp. NBC_01294]WRZ59704.1 hypothetical protein OG534_26415 [Streptomyces sp. NBC_01294]
MRDPTRRKLGTIAGVYLAIALLPGITVDGEGSDVALAGIMAAFVLVIVGQIILISPSSDWRGHPRQALLVLAALGFVQDFLLWLLLSWAFPQTGFPMEVTGLGTMALAALLTRGLSLALLLLLPPSPEHLVEA